MSTLVELPVDAETTVLVEVDAARIPSSDDLELASPGRGKALARAPYSLADALSQLAPVMKQLRDQLTVARPDGMTVEFGVELGGETGIILAKGTAGVNFKITLSWERHGGAGPADQRSGAEAPDEHGGNAPG